jgi:hypothetical protein
VGRYVSMLVIADVGEVERFGAAATSVPGRS